VNNKRPNETNYDTILGKMAVEQGLCTNEELRQCIEELQSRKKVSPTKLENLLTDMGYITVRQAERLRELAKESKAAVQQIPGYKITGKLGAGAMAVVYKAEQLSLNRMVAIKILPKKFSSNAEYVQRFYKEGRAAARLNHPNIVQAIDVGEAGGYHYFVMEYVEGKTIYDDLASGKVFSEQEALEIITQVANALGHAHLKGLIHRDVKPKNIMITKQGIVKLADMGLARGTADIEAAKTEKGKAYGTPYYIAPEQIRGEMDIDGRVDIYGLGATLYHMITGRVPFMADDPADVMRKHLREQLIPPDHINTALSAGISEVVEIMMAKRKADRYENIEELMLDIEAIQSGQPPYRARKRFDVSMLEQLEDGEPVEEEEDVYEAELITKYRTIIGFLAVGLGLAVIIIIILLLG